MKNKMKKEGEGKMSKNTNITQDATTIVMMEIKASYPCTFAQLSFRIFDQVCGVESKEDADGLATHAINTLCRQGSIELYDTGDAWTLA